MARLARGQYMDPSEVQIFHTIQRCVRQAYLCGEDTHTGFNYEHRRQWIRDRLEFLASIFAIDCLTYTILSNHLHLVLRSRPDVAEQWSDEEVACRWWRLFPKKRDQLGQPTLPTKADLGLRASNKGFLNVSLKEYLELVDWTGRSIRADKRGAIPDHLAPILARIGLLESGWCELVREFGRLFQRAAGQAQSLADEAERRNQNYLRAPDFLRFSSAESSIA